ncbi:hypothetical protein MTBBW1_1020017 [Desulfamplus magnetovallimortis]|uniref:Uncharacterized protein n=1 Tax=Desulfamplus magnetovallimortis TaxID=1246637 RepID=A0A1W1H4T2_9BACT|nr:hypothetical protein MTBBW1_1020017 [Desulfamplus magnetovallimortis]
MDNVMENKNRNKTTSIRWHKLLGRMLEELLTPLNITVLTDISVIITVAILCLTGFFCLSSMSYQMLPITIL